MSQAARWHAVDWAQDKTLEQVCAEVVRLEGLSEHTGAEFDDARVRHMAEVTLETLRGIRDAMRKVESEKLTVAGVRANLAQRGVTLRRVEGEYCVRVKGSPSGYGYFTRDLRDALDTGLAMAAEHGRANVKCDVCEVRPVTQPGEVCASCKMRASEHTEKHLWPDW